MKMLTVTFVTMVVVYVCICAAAFFAQRSMLYFPQAPVAVSSGGDTETLQVPGATLNLTVRALAGPRALIYFGGNAENVAYNLTDLSRAFPQHAIYLLHYRGFGGSTGEPTEAVLHADARALFDRVHAAHPYITLIGRSLGSGIAVRLASLRPVARLILVTPYDSIQNIAVQRFPYLPVRWLLLDKFESWKYAPRVSAPTAIIVAAYDEVIPASSSAALYNAFAKGIATYSVIDGVTHDTVAESPAYLQLLAAMSN